MTAEARVEMKVVTAKEARKIDEAAQAAPFGIPAFELMSAAGAAAARVVVERYSPARVLVLCGKGNNGGDGLIVARELHIAGLVVDVLLVGAAKMSTNTASRALEQLRDCGIEARPWTSELLESALTTADVVVDAMLGIGAKGALKGEMAEAAAAVNQSGIPVVAVDVPSGVHEGAAGEEADFDSGEAVRAEVTVTFGAPKLAILVPPGLFAAGEVVVERINFPPKLLDDPQIKTHWADAAELRKWLPQRAAASNKGTFGKVGIVAGSAQFAGAAILSARAALRSGSGLVYIFTPHALNGIYKAALPEAVTIIVPSDSADWLDASSGGAILEFAERSELDALAIGPGLGAGEGQQMLIEMLVAGVRCGTVLDADALNCLAASEAMGGESCVRLPENCVLTPHPGEMARLMGGGATVADVQRDRFGAARGLAQKCGATVLLKGASTVVARPDGQAWIIPGATSALAKAGTGDVLTGCIASLVGQGVEDWKAAVLGASVHLAAGVACGRRSGERGVMAGEVADELGRAMERLGGKTG